MLGRWQGNVSVGRARRVQDGTASRPGCFRYSCNCSGATQHWPHQHSVSLAGRYVDSTRHPSAYRCSCHRTGISITPAVAAASATAHDAGSGSGSQLMAMDRTDLEPTNTAVLLATAAYVDWLLEMCNNLNSKISTIIIIELHSIKRGATDFTVIINAIVNHFSKT